MVIQCPHCRGQITVTPQHGGQQVACPHCRQPFVVPNQPQVPSAFPATRPAPAVPPPADHSQPVSGQPPADAIPAQQVQEPSEALAKYMERREKGSARAIIGIVLVAIGVPLIGLLVWGLSVGLGDSDANNKANNAAHERAQQAKDAATQYLIRYNLQQLSNVNVADSGEQIAVTGSGVRDDKSHTFEVMMRVTRSAAKEVWSVDQIYIDGEIVFPTDG